MSSRGAAAMGEFFGRTRKKAALFLHGSIIFTLVFIVHSNGSGGDWFALVQFKQSILDDPSSAMASWSSFDPQYCSWNGIICDHEKRVVGINLPDCSLSGTLPGELAALGSLQRINLRANKLSGAIPTELSALASLHKLILGDNKLTGQLPPQLGALPNLETLDVGGNELTGRIPAGLGGASRLELLDLSRNRFEGEIPGELGSLVALRGTLNLSNNALSGTIPSNLGNLPRNLSIDLRWNQLSGRIPRVGALALQPPQAFAGNPSLCGPPLAVACPGDDDGAATPTDSNTGTNTPASSPVVVQPSGGGGVETGGGGRSLGIKQILAIAVGDAVGIVLLGFVFIYCCRRRNPCDYLTRERSKRTSDAEDPSPPPRWKSCCCCGGGEWLDEGGELVVFDGDGDQTFDLEELLRASAYVISKGGGSIVYKAVLESGATLAVRRLAGDGGGRRQKEFESEVQVIGKLRHPSIVRLRGYYCGPDERLLIYDYIPSGSLATALHGQAAPYSLTTLTWVERLKIARCVADALTHIHESGARRCHGDLRPRNILLNSSMDAFVADFGLSQLVAMSGSAVASRSGSRNESSAAPLAAAAAAASHSTIFNSGAPISSSSGDAGAYGDGDDRQKEMKAYRPPEAAMSKPTQKWDVYAFGIVLLELISGRSAPDPQPPQQQRRQTHPATAATTAATAASTSSSSLVEWAQKLWEGKRAIQEIIDPRLSQSQAPPQHEVAELVRVAIACVAASPDRRPKMKQVFEWIKKIRAL